MIDDVTTSGGAKLEAAVPLREAGLVVEDVLVVIDRSDDRSRETLASAGLRLHSVLTARELLEHLRSAGAAGEGDIRRALDFLHTGGT
jgi:orotate phosphoribosyltransferase